jgi:hypothetical protein
MMKRILVAGMFLLLMLGLVLSLAGPAIAQENGNSGITGGFSIDQFAPGHKIPRGAIVRQFKNGSTRVYNPDNSLILNASDSASATVPTPVALARATHVFIVPSGSTIETHGNKTEVYENDSLILSVYIDGTLAVPQFSGWVEQANNWSVSNLDNFSANWTVPSNPPGQSTDAVDFLFNAIEPQAGNAIIQPVLEWNQAGTHGWTLRSWYGPVNGNYYCSAPVNASSGNKISGTMSYTSVLGWNITTRNVTTYRSTSIRTNAVKSNNLAVFVALEGYNIDGNIEVPGTSTFNNMVFSYKRKNINIAWQSLVDKTCGLPGLAVNIFSSSKVVLRTANP